MKHKMYSQNKGSKSDEHVLYSKKSVSRRYSAIDVQQPERKDSEPHPRTGAATLLDFFKNQQHRSCGAARIRTSTTAALFSAPEYRASYRRSGNVSSRTEYR